MSTKFSNKYRNRTKFSNKYRNLRNEIGKHYHTLCRLCLSKTSSKLHLLHFEEGRDTDIQGKILNCLALIVTEDDSLPKFVCYSCIGKLDNFQEFRDMCHESENLLKDILSADDKSGNKILDSEKSSASLSHGSEETATASVSDMGFPSSEVFIKCETELVDTLDSEQTSLQDMWPPDQLNVNTETTSFLVAPDVDSSVDSELSSQYMEETAVASVESSSGGSLVHFESAPQDINSRGQNVFGSEEFYQCKSEQFDEKVPALDNDDNVVIYSDKDMKNSVENPDQAEGEVAVPGERYENKNDTEMLLEMNDISRCDRHLLLSSDHFNQACVQEQLNINSEFISKQGILEPVPSPKSSDRKSMNIHNARSNKKKQQYVCSLCNKCFPSKALLITHAGVHNKQIPFKCSNCSKGFSHKGKLNVHMRIHNNEKPFDCSLCKKGFTQKSNLNQHMKIHTKEKPFDCSICNKGFRQKAHLHDHMRIHNKGKTFDCSVCKKGFSRKSNLRKHIKIHTQEKPFDCSICNKGLTQKSNLNDHFL